MTNNDILKKIFYVMKVISTSFVEGLMIRNELDLAESYRVEGVYAEKNYVAWKQREY